MLGFRLENPDTAGWSDSKLPTLTIFVNAKFINKIGALCLTQQLTVTLVTLNLENLSSDLKIRPDLSLESLHGDKLLLVPHPFHPGQSHLLAVQRTSKIEKMRFHG